MLKNYISLFIFLISLNLLLNNCTDNITYSGKIIDTNYNYKLIKTKEELIKTFGKPSYIDIIDKNYYYYSEETKDKNYFNKTINSSIVLLFKIDNDGNIIFSEKYTLLNKKFVKLNSDSTEHKLIDRGIIEKIFGGVGKQSLPNSL